MIPKERARANEALYINVFRKKDKGQISNSKFPNVKFRMQQPAKYNFVQTKGEVLSAA